MTHQQGKYLRWTALVLSTYALQAQAVGISLMEVGVGGLGNAYAGSTAEANDASVIFYNPAALTRLKKAEQVIAAVAIKADVQFKDQASGSNGYPAGGIVYERDPSYALAPNNFLAFPINDKLVVGVGISGSAGLIVRYPSDYPGELQSKTTDIKVTRVNGGFGYKVSDMLSVGMNLSLERFFQSIATDIDYAKAASAEPGLIGAGGTVLSNPLAGGAFNTATGSNKSGALKLRLFGTQANYQVGTLFEPTNKLRFGLSFRPKTRFKLRGYYKFESIPPAALQAAAGSLLSDGIANQNLTMPSELRMSVFYQATPAMAVMADITRFDYSSIKNVEYVREDGSTLKNYVQNLKAGNRFAVGLNYRLFRRLTLKSGISYDQRTSSDQYRVTALPDQARRNYNAGFSYEMSKDSFLDMGYQFTKFDNAAISNRQGIQGVQGEKSFDGNLAGTVAQKIQFLGVQFHGGF